MSVSTAAPLETLCRPGFCLMRLATTRPSGSRRVKRVPTPLGLRGQDAGVAVLGKAVGGHGAPGAAGHFHQFRVIAAHDDGTALSHPGEERGELGVNLLESLVVVQVIRLDVRDDGRRRGEVGEGLVGLVGLHHVGAAAPGMGVGAVGPHDAADEEGGIVAHGVQRAGEHGRGRRLPMGARHGQRVQIAPEASEHLGAVHDGKVAPARLDELGVVLQDGRGDDHRHVAVGDVRAVLADEHGDPRIAQLLGVAALLDVRARHGHALVVGDPGDAAHADAADPDKVKLLLFAIHVASPFVLVAIPLL